jgi:hypothetical protein
VLAHIGIKDSQESRQSGLRFDPFVYAALHFHFELHMIRKRIFQLQWGGLSNLGPGNESGLPESSQYVRHLEWGLTSIPRNVSVVWARFGGQIIFF